MNKQLLVYIYRIFFLACTCLCALFFFVHPTHATYCITTGQGVAGYARTGQGCPATPYKDCRTLPFSTEESVSGWGETRSVSTKSFCTGGGKNCSSQWSNKSYTYGDAHGFCQGRQCIAPFAPLIDTPKLGTAALNASINDQIDSCFNECPQPDICGVAVGPIPETSTTAQFTVNGLVAGNGIWNGTHPWSYYMTCGGYTHEGAVPLGDRISIGGHFDNIANNQNCNIWLNGVNGFVAQKSFTVQRNIPYPSVTSFTANGNTGTIYINSGDTVRLDWTTRHINTVSITSSPNDPKLSSLASKMSGYANGNVTNLQPKVDTTYTIVGTNEAGSTSPISITIKISKPIIWGFTANGVTKKIVIIEGQEVRLDWNTNSTDEIWINGLSDKINNDIKYYKYGGEVVELKPSSSTTYTLRARNQQWGFADEVTIIVEVQNPDKVKLMSCLGWGLLSGFGSGFSVGASIVLFSPAGASCAITGGAVGSGIPLLGTIVGAIVGYLGCATASGVIAGIAGATAMTVGCYYGIDYDPRNLQKVLDEASKKPFSLSIEDNRPPVDFKIKGSDRIELPPAPSGGPSGVLTTNAGGSDQTANWLQTISAEKSAWHYDVEPDTDPTKSGNVRVKGDQTGGGKTTLTNQQAQAILGACGSDIGCVRSRANATLGINESTESDPRKKVTDEDIKMLFPRRY